MERVAVYVDGFNLYYGIKSKGWQRYYWLDLCRLAENLLRPCQALVSVHYFTARVSSEPNDPDKPKRQNTYLEALSTISGIQIHFGYFLPKVMGCHQCGATWQGYEEKMTDVNIAVELLGDAHADRFDTAIIISADSDLSGPIGNVRSQYPVKRVVVAFPPGRASKKMRQVSTGHFTIGRDALRDSQLPHEVTGPNGHILQRPPEWG